MASVSTKTRFSAKLQVALSTDLFTDKRVRQKDGQMDNLPHSKPWKLLPRQRKQGTSWRRIAPRLGQVPKYTLYYQLIFWLIRGRDRRTDRCITYLTQSHWSCCQDKESKEHHGVSRLQDTVKFQITRYAIFWRTLIYMSRFILLSFLTDKGSGKIGL